MSLHSMRQRVQAIARDPAYRQGVQAVLATMLDAGGEYARLWHTWRS